jgi:hypothetical protein
VIKPSTHTLSSLRVVGCQTRRAGSQAGGVDKRRVIFVFHKIHRRGVDNVRVSSEQRYKGAHKNKSSDNKAKHKNKQIYAIYSSQCVREGPAIFVFLRNWW